MPGPSIASATISVDLDGRRIPAEAAALGAETGAAMGRAHNEGFDRELNSGAFSRTGEKLARELKDNPDFAVAGKIIAGDLTTAFGRELQARARGLQSELAQVFTEKGGIQRFADELNKGGIAVGNVDRAVAALKGKMLELNAAGGLTGEEFKKLNRELSNWTLGARSAEAAALRNHDALVRQTEALVGHRTALGNDSETLRVWVQELQRTVEPANALERELGKLVTAQRNSAAGFRDGRISAEELKKTFSELDPKIRVLADALNLSDDAIRSVVRGERDVGALFTGLEQGAKKSGNEVVGLQDRLGGLLASFKSFGIIGLVIGAVAALAPAVVGLGAGVLDLAAAFGALAGESVLVVLGMRQAIAANTEMGQKFQAVVDSLLASLHQLEGTAATATFAGLSGAVGILKTNLGSLNTVVAELGAPLGGLLKSLVQLSVSVVTNLAPAFLDGTRALKSFVDATNGYFTSNGLTDFIKFAAAQLPGVLALLGSILGAFGGLFTGLAPGASGFIFLLGNLFDLIGSIGRILSPFTAILGGVASVVGLAAGALNNLITIAGPLAPLLVSIVAGFLLFNKISPTLAVASGAMQKLGTAIVIAADGAKVAAPAVRGLGLAIDALGGPVGLVVAGIALLATAFLTMQEDTKSLASSQQDLQTALENDGGAIGRNVQELTAHQLVSDGAAAAARRLGVDLATVRDAADGNTAAIAKVKEATSGYTSELAIAGQAAVRFHQQGGTQVADAKLLNSAISDQNLVLKAATQAYNDYAVQTGRATLETNQLKDAAARSGIHPGDYVAAAQAQQQLADKTNAAHNAMILENDAAGLLKESLDLLNGKTIDAASAQNQFDSQIANMAQHVDKTGKYVKRANDLITGFTAAAVANRGELIQGAAQAQITAEAYGKFTGSTELGREKLIQLKDALIKHAEQLGFNKQETEQFVNSLLKIPPKVTSTLEMRNAEHAKKLADDARKAALAYAQPYGAELKANNVPATTNIADAARKAHAFAVDKYESKLTGDPTKANAASKQAATQAKLFADALYKAILKADKTQADQAAKDAARISKQYAQGKYQATITANTQPAHDALVGLLGFIGQVVGAAVNAAGTIAKLRAGGAVGGVVSNGLFVGGGKRFATGGIVNSPTWLSPWALAGEAGAEAIVPLTGPLQNVDKSVRQLSAYARGMNVGGDGSPSKVIYVQPTINVPTSDPVAAAGYVVDRLVPQL